MRNFKRLLAAVLLIPTLAFGQQLGTSNSKKATTSVSPVYNVMSPEYGCLGNGTTDDTACLQEALDAAAATNGTVLLPIGNYLTTGITADSNVSIQGMGRGSKITAKTGTTTLLAISPTGTTTPLAYRDFWLYGNSIATTILYLGEIDDLQFSNVTLDSSSVADDSTCLVLDDTQNTHFDSLVIRKCEKGIKIANGASNNVFTNVQVIGHDDGHVIIAGEAGLPNGAAGGDAEIIRNNLFQGSQFEIGRNASATKAGVKVINIAGPAEGTTFIGGGVHGTVGAGGWGMYLDGSDVEATLVIGGRWANSSTTGYGFQIVGAVGTILNGVRMSGAANWLASDERTLVLYPTTDGGTLSTAITDTGAAEANEVILLEGFESAQLNIEGEVHFLENIYIDEYMNLKAATGGLMKAVVANETGNKMWLGNEDFDWVRLKNLKIVQGLGTDIDMRYCFNRASGDMCMMWNEDATPANEGFVFDAPITAGGAGSVLTASAATDLELLVDDGNFVEPDTLKWKPCADTASGATITVDNCNMVTLTGTTAVTTINTCNAANKGREILILCGAFDDLITDGGNLALAGSLTCTSEDTIRLVCDGSTACTGAGCWLEVSRSVN